MPASNEKLVTSATALADWGSDYRFKTELLTSGTLSAKGVFTDQIYLKGFGDPSQSLRCNMAESRVAISGVVKRSA